MPDLNAYPEKRRKIPDEHVATPEAICGTLFRVYYVTTLDCLGFNVKARTAVPSGLTMSVQPQNTYFYFTKPIKYLECYN